jgi:hypothetical protein
MSFIASTNTCNKQHVDNLWLRYVNVLRMVVTTSFLRTEHDVIILYRHNSHVLRAALRLVCFVPEMNH